MRLTNYIRDAFVSAVMQDVPKVNYDEQIRAKYKEAMLALMPPELVGHYEKNKDWFNHGYRHVPGCHLSINVVCPDGEHRDPKPEHQKQIDALAEAYRNQRKTRTELQAKLHGVAYGCTTRKALAEALPEFEKYLPKEDEKPSKSLPALANLVADFTKAGWPKEQTTVSA
jgi:Nucleotide modification associated domain 5